MLAGGATAGVVFAGVLAVTFPTDAVVRHALARVTLPAGSALVFARAALGPSGFSVEQLALRRPDGTALATADWLVLRPSLAGFLHDGTGRPWRAHGQACGGTLEAVLDGDGAGDAVALAWHDVDLGGCPVFSVGGESFAGRADGAATLREQAAAGDGTLRIRDGVWSGARRLVPGMDALHADTATVRWTLRQAELGLTAIELAARELRMTGTGTILLATPLDLSAVDLGLVLTPGPGASGLLRGLLSALPPSAAESPDARRVAVTGTVGALRVAVAP
jgi:type II secretion system protein N